MKDIKSLRKHFTPEELEELRKYTEDVKTWKAKEPKQLTEEERTQIYTYGAAHEWTPPEEYKGRIILESYIDLEDGCDTEHPKYDYYIVDTEYEYWKYDIYRIAPVNTIVKLLYYINEANQDAKNVLFGYAPEDEENRQQIERAIKDLLGETATEEDIRNVSYVVVSFPEKSSQLQITHKDYQFALWPYKNDKAYIVDLDKQLEFKIDESGEPTIDLRTPESYEAYTHAINKESIAATIADTDLLSTLAAAVLSSYCSNCGFIITVYFPNFAKALGVQIENDESSNNHFDIWKKIRQLENIGGVLVEDESVLRAFVMLGHNKKDNTLTFASPYLYRLMDILQKNPASVSKTIKNDKPLWEIVGTSFLIDNQIIKARNKITSQLVKNIIAGLYQYGVKTEAARHPGKTYVDRNIVCYQISFQSLIERTPLLNETLQTSQTSNKARILTRSFLGANYSKSGITIIEEYMKEYTHAFEYWKDLQIVIPTPSLKSLNDRIVITHHGINGDFKNDLYMPRIEEKHEKGT